MNKISVKEITLEGFRGIYNKNTLEFGNCRGIILYGDNGTGKTSFSEGAEWLLYDEIEKLKREGCHISDARHLQFPTSENSYVAVKLTNDVVITKSISADGRVAISQPPGSNILNELSKDNIILSYTKLREFVDKSKKEKMVSFLEVSGYGGISNTRDEIKRSLGKIEQEIEGAVLGSRVDGLKDQIINKSKNFLGEEIKRDAIDPDAADGFVRNILKSLSEKYKLQLNLSDEIIDLIKQIEDSLVKGGAGKDFLQLEEFQRLYKNIVIDPQLKNGIDEVHSKITSLLADRDKIETLSFGAFYQKGKELFEKLKYSKNVCPFCDQKIAIDELQKLIDAKLRLSSELNKDKNNILEDLEKITTTVKSLSQSICATQNYYKNYFNKQISFPEINPEVALASYKYHLERLDIPEKLVIEQITSFPQRAHDAIEKLKELYSEKSKVIVKPSQKLNEISEAVIQIKDIRSLFSSLKKQSVIKKKFESQRQALKQILELFEEFERGAMQSVLHILSQDINRYYTILHKQDAHEDVRLDISDKGRGITFKLKFHGQDVDQPIKYLSDSHLNSLGLCFFLASVKNLNNSTNFVILDDVVNSIDANHRRQLIEIIRDHFQDYQFLILTHDRTWFEMLNQQLAGLGWKPYEIISWQLQSVMIEPTKDRIQKVQELIDKSNSEGVALHLRKYLEQDLKHLCKKYHVAVEYKDEYRPEDLWQPLKSNLKSNTYIDPDSSQYRGLFNDIGTNRYLLNIELHDSSKKNLTVSKGDLKYALDKYIDFLNLFRCKKCTKAVKLTKAGYQCPCGDKFTP